MPFNKIAILLSAVLITPGALAYERLCNLSDVKVIAEDGTFLGNLNGQFDSKSIFNEFGYGSEFRSESVWNEFGSYGSEFSSESVMNEFTSTPPMLIRGGKVVGYLTVNSNLDNAINPKILKAHCM
ncbi:TPA: hypothetical protein ACGUUJ_004428 [Vibrio vulnificus]|uniref:hypothetical protein n=1 Tax=Vibrio vulnificus TaxID=672 RepID=UPI0010234487|nr:hypothetical protein [Vibrio vulnificus]EKY4883340.1 hypothetical protein [Vibrio vulnificus]RZQ09687.1 hypothetical protein D8T50_22070 [Vibrio vulnificus]WNJ69100.1 hypothetical protein RI132_08170 [Vibrio vulnificus]HAS6154385.1 hypothetical protein [Vibrio vulnificus]HAS6235532.1 hypothetical protein [Vibrio vulnificus]